MQVALDVDTGVDDAMAILFALRHPQIDVRAISCVTGNVPVDQVVTNTLRVLDAIDAPDVPVARGAERPLLNPPPEGDSVHGRDGLADLGLPRPAREPVRAPAVDLLARAIGDAPEPITLVGLAPLTNLALFVRVHPDALRRLEQIVLVGGRLSGRPHTAGRGDFNMSADPEAAAIVLGCGVPITMYSLDVFARVQLGRVDAERLAATADPAARLAGRLALHQVRRFGGERGTIGDAGAVISLVMPYGLTTAEHRIEVSRCGDSCGRIRTLDISDSVCDEADRATTRVATAVDGAAYARAFLDAVDGDT